MLWCLRIKAKLSTFCSLNSFLSFFDLHSIPLTPATTITTTTLFFLKPVYLSRSLLLPLPLSPLMFQSMNKWLLLFSLRVLGQHKLLLLPRKIGFGRQTKKKKEREKHVRRKVLQRMTRRAVSQELNTFASLSSDWRIKRHSSTPSSPGPPPPQTCLWTWQLHFISSFWLSLFISAPMSCLLQT